MFEKKKKGISGMAKKDTYDADSISVLEGLEAVRSAPVCTSEAYPERD